MSPVELVDHCLSRIADLDHLVGAFVTVTAEAAREQARTAERRLRADRSASVEAAMPWAHRRPELPTSLNEE